MTRPTVAPMRPTSNLRSSAEGAELLSPAPPPLIILSIVMQVSHVKNNAQRVSQIPFHSPPRLGKHTLIPWVSTAPSVKVFLLRTQRKVQFTRKAKALRRQLTTPLHVSSPPAQGHNAGLAQTQLRTREQPTRKKTVGG